MGLQTSLSFRNYHFNCILIAVQLKTSFYISIQPMGQLAKREIRQIKGDQSDTDNHLALAFAIDQYQLATFIFLFFCTQNGP